MKEEKRNNQLIIALALISLIIGGIFLWQTTKKTTETPAETILENNPATGTTSNTTITVTDLRILLTPENLSNYNSPENPQCDEQFNTDPANTTVPYSNEEKGISFEVPYNPSWGNEKFKIPAYWEEKELEKDMISFGPIQGFEACMWARLDYLKFNETRNAEAIIEELNSLEPQGLISYGPNKIEINGLTIVKYSVSGMCDSPTMEIIGEKYNYQFEAVCSTDIEKSFEYLEGIVKNVELL